MAAVTAEITWLRWLLEDFGVMACSPTPLSFGAINIARDSVKHELTKHIDVDASYMRSQRGSSVCAFRVSVVGLLHEGSNKGTA